MLKLVLDSLDGLGEALAELYEERDGKFHLKVEGASGDDEKERLKRSLESGLAPASISSSVKGRGDSSSLPSMGRSTTSSPVSRTRSRVRRNKTGRNDGIRTDPVPGRTSRVSG